MIKESHLLVRLKMLFVDSTAEKTFELISSGKEFAVSFDDTPQTNF